MKHKLFRWTVWLLIAAFTLACSGSAGKKGAVEQSAIWQLGDRYSSNYSTLTYFATYESEGEPFCLRINRNKKETGSSPRVKEFTTVDGIVYALCESKKRDQDGAAAYTYYECFTGSFRYFIGRESDGFYMDRILSMDDAIALIASPESPKRSVRLTSIEWNALYRNDAANLEILIRPKDQGALMRSFSAGYHEETDGTDKYLLSDSGDAIVYSDGTDSIEIRQAVRSGSSGVSYITLSECKAILAMLKDS